MTELFSENPFSFSEPLTLLVWQQQGHLAHKNSQNTPQCSLLRDLAQPDVDEWACKQTKNHSSGSKWNLLTVVYHFLEPNKSEIP